MATRSGRVGVEHLEGAEPQHVAVGGGHPLQAPVVGRLAEQRRRVRPDCGARRRPASGRTRSVRAPRSRRCRNASASAGLCRGSDRPETRPAGRLRELDYDGTSERSIRVPNRSGTLGAAYGRSVTVDERNGRRSTRRHAFPAAAAAGRPFAAPPRRTRLPCCRRCRRRGGSLVRAYRRSARRTRSARRSRTPISASCQADGAVDVLVVRRLAADHGAQAKHGRILAGSRPGAAAIGGISNAPGTQATSIVARRPRRASRSVSTAPSSSLPVMDSL